MFYRIFSRSSAYLTRSLITQNKKFPASKLLKSYTPVINLNLSSNVLKCFYSNDLKSDSDLHKFLIEEIKSEKELCSLPKNGKNIPGFETTTDGSNVTLKRKYNNEIITIKFNVNASVDDGSSEFSESIQQEPEEVTTEMKSKPDFIVEIKKPNDKSLIFNCSFLEDAQEADQTEKSDLFEIENFFILENGLTVDSDISDNQYMGDGSLIDGQFYDLLMDYLDERGIGCEFAENLVNFSTYYEHQQYISLLEKMGKFISNN